MIATIRTPRAVSGFTLIEVLAAFVILSIGLLGIVSLQALSKTSQHQGLQRTRAVTLADEMVERIRLNPAGMATYVAATILGKGELAVPDPDCSAATCTAVQLATYDLWEWEQALLGAADTAVVGGSTVNTGGLVTPRGCIDFSAATDKTNTGMLSVIVQWRGLEATSDGWQNGDAICGDAADFGGGTHRRQVVVGSYIVDRSELL
ncbi:MAG: type IV pilus modification protein PilV [Parahaliea sp.]